MSSSSYLTASAHGVGQLVFHAEWCTKYRYRMLRQRRYKDLLSQTLLRETEQMRVNVLEMGIQDEHVHLVLALRSTHSVSKVFEILKSKSARALFNAEPKFRLRYPRGHFWGAGKFYRSVGDVDLQTTREYVRAQDHRQLTLPEFSAGA